MQTFRLWENPRLQQALQDHPILLASLGMFALVFIGIAAIKRLRPTTQTSGINGDQLAKNFEDLSREGVIDEAELRRIKAVLGETQGKRPGEST
ncbi:MAG: hypothetical protein KatS3mg111_1652 [Pirellulaceae bacterium]|nr:MAG: hypothetical protein KatS3mg111_1652 [Pirellulaceae bacterium]